LRDRSGRPPGVVTRVWRLGRRVAVNAKGHNLTIIAAGMAYKAIFALFPALAALVSIYGLVVDPQMVAQQMAAVDEFLPGQASKIIGEELNKLATMSGASLSLSFLVSLGIALGSVGSGIIGLIKGLNVAYHAKEGRGFLRLRALALAMALGGTVVAAISLALVAVVPAALSFLPLGELAAGVISAVRWPIVAVIVVLALSVVYRWGPCRYGVHWRLITWGSAACTLLWMGGSAVLSLYITNFGKYDQTYGSIGGAMVLLLWLQFSALTVLVGAEVDAELEEQHGIPTSREEPAESRTGGRPGDRSRPAA
jgi:membrane protein